MKCLLLSIVVFIFLIFTTSCSDQVKNDVTVYDNFEQGLTALSDKLTYLYLSNSTNKNTIKKLAILPFSDSNCKPKGIGNYISSLLQIKLFNRSAFTLLERERIASLIDEHKLSLSGLIDYNSITKIGNLLGADLVCVGTVYDLNNTKIIARFVDINSGAVVSIADVLVNKNNSPPEITESSTPKPTPQVIYKTIEVQKDYIQPQTSYNNNNDSITVYVTKTGNKYHRLNCRYLKKSSIPIKLVDAKRNGYTPCSVCRPPE